MNMQDKAAMLKTSIRTLRLPQVPVNGRKALGAFLLLQIYFASNILSFGFWKSDSVVFGYLTVFYGFWLVGLTLLLFLFLRISTRFGLTRFDSVVFVTLSLPFGVGLWLPTLEVHIGKLWWIAPPAHFCHVHLLSFRSVVYRTDDGSHDWSLQCIIYGAFGIFS